MFRLKISRSVIIYISVFAFLVLIYSFIFQYLMRVYEARDYGFITAIYWVLVSMTTVGYGDIYFTTPAGYLFSSLVILSGVLMIFAYLFPLVVTPQLEKTFRKDLPTKAPDFLNNHIIICGYNQLVETLILELEEFGIPFIIIDEHEKNITGLLSRKIFCVHGDSTDEKVLINSNIMSAKMIMANQSDEKNADIILTAKELRNIKVIAVVENMSRASYLKYAGADRVISPKTLFGTYIGRKAIDPLTEHLAGATRFFEDLNIVEFPIHPGSILVGKKLKDAAIRQRAGANIVGLWVGGRLSLNPHHDDMIKENSILLAVGTEKQLEDLKKLTR
ncbi:MAG: potassium channel protein [Candidatus Methanoperedens sp.]|nr:potassium channel protein [Candidatus Methanoperedens sp.]MCE8428884.1 potassium channel protein [Candidatus Methanoperedens sp.]